MSVEDFMLPCPTKKLFGIDCFGCGFQRSLLMFLHGDFSGAWQLYPPLFTILPLLLVGVLHLFDKQRHYGKLLRVLAIINGTFIPLSYFFKHF